MDQVMEGDALLILMILDLFVVWCSRETVREQSSSQSDLPIFLSVGSAHSLEQEQFLRHLRSELAEVGVNLCQLSNNAEFSEERPFDQIRDLMSRCKAALVVGVERSHAYAVFERERSRRQRLYSDQYIPTAWNQIEGAIASALRLPILILKEKRLHNEGIFEADNHRHRREVFDLSAEAKGLSPGLRAILAGWVNHVRAQAAAPQETSS
jgi:hypothetical protein